MAEAGREVDAHKREFMEFLERDVYEGKYVQKLQECIKDETFRLVVNVNDLRDFSTELAEK